MSVPRGSPGCSRLRGKSAPGTTGERRPAAYLERAGTWHAGTVPVTIEDVRRAAQGLPRSYEVLVHDRVKFRVGSIVWLAFNREETEIGFAFPKEEREALVATEPKVFHLPRPSDLRFNWVEARLAGLDEDRLREIVLDAWRMVVPRTVASSILDAGDPSEPATNRQDRRRSRSGSRRP